MIHSLKKIQLLVATLVALDIHLLGVYCSQGGNAIIPIPDPAVCVWRRDARDLVYTDRECTTLNVCPGSQPTYLISDRGCISNQDIAGMCGFKLVPFGMNQQTTNSIGVVFDNASISMWYTRATLLLPAQVVYYNQTQEQQLHNCFIVSLEVFRGLDTFTRINHRGFTLGTNNTIQVDERRLAYNRTNYNGELYRMNIRCQNNDIVSTDHDCVIFKLLDSKQTSIWKAKFNCTVPGTNESKMECLHMEGSMNPTIDSVTTHNISGPPSTTTMGSDGNRNNATDTMIPNIATTEQEDQQVLYLIIGTGGSAGVLVIIVVVLFCVVCFQCTRDAVSNTVQLSNLYHGRHSLHQIQLPTIPESPEEQITQSIEPGVTTFQNEPNRYNLKPNPLYSYRNQGQDLPTQHAESIYAEVMP